MPILKKGQGFCHLPTSESKDSGRRPAVFLDRDGVINEEVGFITSPSQLRILPGATAAMRSLAPWFRLVVVTNQSGIARGLYTEEDLLNVNQALTNKLAEDGAFIDAIYYCPHLPEGAVAEYSIICECRKPMTGMLQRASRDLNISLKDSYMVGDTDRDIQAGNDSGATSIMVGDVGDDCPQPVITATGLLEAAKLILDRSGLNMEQKDVTPSTASEFAAAARRRELA